MKNLLFIYIIGFIKKKQKTKLVSECWWIFWWKQQQNVVLFFCFSYSFKTYF